MPRSKHNPKDISAAANLVLKENWSIRRAALEMKVPKSTLARHLNMNKLTGSDTYDYVAKNDVCHVFSDDDENILKDYLLQACSMHYGLTRKQFRCLELEFAQANEKNYPKQWDRDGMAGKQFYYEFMRRHKDSLSLRKPQATSLSRSTSFNRENVGEFFNKLKLVQEREMFTPDRIYNIDETGITTVHNPGNVISPKGSKQVGSMTSGERGINITMISAINAIGNSVPPAFVFPRVHFKENMMKGAPPGSFGTAHVSGWSNSEIFVRYLQHFIAHAKPSPENKILIIMDNHKSHISVESLQLAKDSGIILLTFLPHTSHKLQPLDKTVFGPFKKYYNSACSEWMLTHCGQPITIYDVAECTGKAYPLAFTPQNISSGFRVSGIWPVNEDIFTDDEFLTSYVTDRPNPCVELRPETSGTSKQNESGQEANLPGPSTMSLISPQQIRPYPKAPERKMQRVGPKKGRCRILTDTPEKSKIEEEAQKVKAKKGSQMKKRVKRKIIDSTSSEDEILSQTSNESVEEYSSSDESLKTMPDDIKEGDFALVRVLGKKKEHFYVAEIVTKKYSDLNVKYLKRIKTPLGITNKFVYNSDAMYEMTIDDVLYKLPAPIHIGGRPTARQSKFLLFNVNFDEYDVE